MDICVIGEPLSTKWPSDKTLFLHSYIYSKQNENGLHRNTKELFNNEVDVCAPKKLMQFT